MSFAGTRNLEQEPYPVILRSEVRRQAGGVTKNLGIRRPVWHAVAEILRSLRSPRFFAPCGRSE